LLLLLYYFAIDRFKFFYSYILSREIINWLLKSAKIL